MYRKIMVPLDGSQLAECVLAHVEAIGVLNKSAEIMLVQAVEPISIPYGREAAKVESIEQLKTFEAHNKAEAEKYLAETATRLAKAGVNARPYVVFGKAAEALAEFATKNSADLVVIATHGRSGVSRWVWGSVADRLLRSIIAPILVIRAPGCTPGI
ncbi:MAG: universal stress protein [Dehalococcoidia bacterium]|nr:MAG: universal stress protein [Dehalococcoidia bacterium]